jgi:hypothetical protein
VPGLSRRARAVPEPPALRVVVLGIDGTRPGALRDVMERFPDLTRNWAKAAVNGIHPLTTSTPPQSPVAWSNFITGRDPGGHGIYDFIHRDPMTRAPLSSTVKTTESEPISLPGAWQFPIGGDSESNRSGVAFWTCCAITACRPTSWRMPANFPSRASDGWSFSGMMTPAIDSAYGALHAVHERARPRCDRAEGASSACATFDGRIDTALTGPPNPFRKDGRARAHPAADPDRPRRARGRDRARGPRDRRARGRVEQLACACRSACCRGTGRRRPGIVRFHVKSLDPFEMYASPVNIDPIDPIAPVSEPAASQPEVAERIGPTTRRHARGRQRDQGGVLTTWEFVAQSDLVHAEGVKHARRRVRALESAQRFLFFYFSGVDLCSHMLWRHHDAGIRITMQNLPRGTRRPGRSGQAARGRT